MSTAAWRAALKRSHNIPTNTDEATFRQRDAMRRYAKRQEAALEQSKQAKSRKGKRRK